MGTGRQKEKGEKALRKRAEELLRKRVGDVEPETLSAEEARRLVHELQVHQIELEMQNEELRLSQEMLEESRQKYTDLYDRAPVGYFTFDREGVILGVNLTGASLLGVERGSLIGKPFPLYIKRDSQDEFYLHRRSVLEGRKMKTCELKLKTGAGREFHAELESLPAKDNTIRTAVSDITERKRAGEALAESEERYRAIFDQARDGIVLMDYNSGAVLNCNAEFEKQTGRTLEELRAMKIWELRPPDKVEAAKRKFGDVREKGEIAARDLSFLRSDGGVTEVDIVSKVVTIRGKKYIQGITRDITELKKAEEALHVKETAIASSINAIVMADLEGNLTYVNGSFLRLMGYESEEVVLGKPSASFAKDEREGARILEAIREEGGWEGEVVAKREDGSRMVARVSASMVRDANGEPLCMMASFDDITEKKQSEEELRKYRQRLEQMVGERTSELMKVNRQLMDEMEKREAMEDEVLKAQKLESIGILAGGIAHDFNNSLCAILNSISVAKMLLEPEDEAFKRLTTAEAATLRARTFTQQLLTFAKGGEPVRKTIAIGRLIRDTADFSLRGSNVNCEHAISKDIWHVHADEGQLAQVISNLVINADQAMPEGGAISVSAENVTLKAEEIPPLTKGKYVRISVSDRGVGIPGNHLPRIFDPYFTTKKGGSGLGLATTYSIVRKHGGHVAVESQVGVGTSFHVYLPASSEKIESRKRKAGRPPAGTARVLLMEDEMLIAKDVVAGLEKLGYSAEHAIDGERAIALYKDAADSGRPFDAVILDLTIRGGMGGRDTIRGLREINKDVKAIVASGYSNDPIMSNFEKYGFSGAISKPYDIYDIVDAIKETLP